MSGLLAVILTAGCSRKNEAKPAPGTAAALEKVVLQTDWLPQAEHGGFYQALAKGFYREAGLAVQILPGGPGAAIKPKVARGDADFGMNRSDDLIVAASQGMPFVIVGAVFQHDPQGLLVHESSPVKTLKDLNGRTVTASVGMTWIPFLQKKHRVTFSLKPNTFGIGAFFADADAIQQCMLTSEPYYAQERGIKVRALPISTSGYDCYHAIFCRRELLQTRPEVVRAFLAASIRGWRDYLEADPEPAHRLILERNPQSSRGLLEYSRSEIIIRSLVIGDATRDEGIGQISLARLMEQQSTLLDLKVLEVPVAINSVATKAFLPPQRR